MFYLFYLHQNKYFVCILNQLFLSQGTTIVKVVISFKYENSKFIGCGMLRAALPLFPCSLLPRSGEHRSAISAQAGGGERSGAALTLSRHLVGRTPRPWRSPGCSSVCFLFNLFFPYLTGDPFCLWVIRTNRFYYFSLGCG